MKSILRFIIIICLETGNCNSQTIASFICPDTVCVNQSFTIQNTSTGGSTYYWNFCSGNINTNPQALNLGNPGNLYGPVYTTIAKDGANYYVFITNNWGGTITRLDFGNSLLNIPVSINLGNLGGVIPTSIEDFQLINENGTWYGIAVGGTGSNSRIARLNFGNSLQNIPTAINMGNIGSLSYPHTLNIEKEAGVWYGLTVNRNGNTITKFIFGNSINNIPIGVNLGNIGLLSNPDGFALINDNNSWFGLITNAGNNTLTRLSFGNSLSNVPLGVNLGVNSSFNTPRGITLIKTCNQLKCLITNELSNDLVCLDFVNGIQNQPNTIIYTNLQPFSFPHDITPFRVGDTLYAFIPNVTNHTLSRIFFSNCTNSSIPSSTLQTPPSISYSSTGVYNISLVVNEGLPTQSNFCKQIVVINGPDVFVSGDSIYCDGDSIRLAASSLTGVSYNWIGPNGFSSTNSNIVIPDVNSNNIGDYSCFVTYGVCASIPQSIHVQVMNILPVNLGNDTSLCNGESIILSPGNGFSNYLWSNGSTLPYLTVDIPGIYSIVVTNGTCKSHDEIKIGECDSEIWVPNVFTPNGDGLNDEFYPVYSNIDNITLYIFNRWGNQLYEGKGINSKWDGRYKGKLCPDGVYTYLIVYSQKRFASETKELHGCVTILK
jgi:gliding motility-associated-like protein